MAAFTIVALFFCCFIFDRGYPKRSGRSTSGLETETKQETKENEGTPGPACGVNDSTLSVRTAIYVKSCSVACVRPVRAEAELTWSSI